MLIIQMIECAKNSNFGCEGGDTCSLLEWLVSTKTKIVPEIQYPLTKKTDTCKIKKYFFLIFSSVISLICLFDHFFLIKLLVINSSFNKYPPNCSLVYNFGGTIIGNFEGKA